MENAEEHRPAEEAAPPGVEENASGRDEGTQPSKVARKADARDVSARGKPLAIAPAVQKRLDDMISKGLLVLMRLCGDRLNPARFEHGTMSHLTNAKTLLHADARLAYARWTRVAESDLDFKVMRRLADYHPEQALDALNQFEGHDVNPQHNNIRNKSAYLSSILARFQKQLGPRQPEEVQSFLDNAFSEGSLKSFLDYAFREGSLKVTDLDAKCYEALLSLPQHAALRLLEKFTHRDRSEVRNQCAFFMSMVKQANQELDIRGPGRDGPSYGRDAPPYGRGDPYGGDPYARGGPPHHSQALAPYRGPHDSPGGHMGGMVPSGQKNYGLEQGQLGVRIEEFHELSPFAVFVHPAPAIKLQQLWDSGKRLVSLMDDRAWGALGELPAAEALIVVEEVAHTIEEKDIRNPNAFFMSVANKYLDKFKGGSSSREGGPGPMVAARHGGGYGGRGGGYGGDRGGQREPYSSTRSSSDGWNPKEPGPGLDSLNSVLRDKIHDLIAANPGQVKDSDFDSGVVESLKKMDERDALGVVDELWSNDIGGIRNVPAFIMGICKRKRGRR
eukprot:gene4868-34629_t